jgi:hypothetical protein
MAKSLPVISNHKTYHPEIKANITITVLNSVPITGFSLSIQKYKNVFAKLNGKQIKISIN